MGTAIEISDSSVKNQIIVIVTTVQNRIANEVVGKINREVGTETKPQDISHLMEQLQQVVSS